MHTTQALTRPSEQLLLPAPSAQTASQTAPTLSADLPDNASQATAIVGGKKSFGQNLLEGALSVGFVTSTAIAVTAPWWLDAIPAVGTPAEAAAAAALAITFGIALATVASDD